MDVAVILLVGLFAKKYKKDEQNKIKFVKNLLRVCACQNKDFVNFIKSDLLFMAKLSPVGIHCAYLNNRMFNS